MNKVVLGGLVLAGCLVLGIIGVVVGYNGFVNQCNGFEANIPAAYDEMRNIYDNGWKEVKEQAQVPDMYASKLKELVQAAISGRYGPSGSNAVVQMITEQNPTLDPGLFLKISQTIERFRRTFAERQTELIAKKQEYTRFLTMSFTSRTYNGLGHYPRIDFAKYAIMTSDKTESDFATKKSEPIDLRR